MDIAELLKDSYKYIGGLITAYLAYRHYYFNKEIELFKEIVSIITEIQRELFNVEEIVLNVKKTQKKIENTCNQLKIESDKIFTDENIEKLTSSGYDIEELRNPFNDLDNICIKGAEASEQLETSWEEGRQMFKKHCNTHSELLESFVIK
nr:hypothetical protein [Candidatus Dadabacteria bacterium]